MDNQSLRALVLNYNTTYPEGFILSEMSDILDRVIKETKGNFNKDKYEEAMYGNTCMVKDGNIITYHTDMLNALKCGIENRDLQYHEWD